LYGLGERGTVGHERRRGDDAMGVSLQNGPVHAQSVAKIVRIDDQTPHPASLAGTGARRTRAWLPCKVGVEES
jgi:hypothetical protein